MTVKIKTNGIDAINQAFKVLTDEIERLRGEIKELKTAEAVHTVTVSAQEEPEIIEENSIEYELEFDNAEAAPEEEVFDWKNSEDEPALIEFAATLGIEADSRATPNSLKRKIKEKLGE